MEALEILLSYDDSSLLRLIEWSLRERGLSVTSVGHPGDAIKALQRQHFDVVITDLENKPKQRLAILKKAKRLDPMTIVMLLGDRTPYAYDPDCLAPEADDFVFTPCSVGILWKRVLSSLERMELRHRNTHCLNSRQQLHELVDEMKQLRNGKYGHMDKAVTAKLTILLKDMQQMIQDTDTMLDNGKRITGEAVNKQTPQTPKAV